MKQLFLIALLVLNSGPAYAEWVGFGTGGNDLTVYIDPETVRRQGDLVKMWIMFDRKTAETRYGEPYLSYRTQIQFDCTEERSRFLASTRFSGNMLTGVVVSSQTGESEWTPVAPQSVALGLWKFACKQ
jgi:hypothetical protein